MTNNSNEITDKNGRRWKMASYPATKLHLIDDLYDQNVRDHKYNGTTRYSVALDLLMEANSELTTEQAITIIRDTASEEITKAVETAIFPRTDEHRTYTDWVISGMAANGIDHNKIHRSRWYDVMTQLQATGRVVPAENFVTTLMKQAAREQLLRTLASND